jgi:hypothetical protein
VVASPEAVALAPVVAAYPNKGVMLEVVSSRVDKTTRHSGAEGANSMIRMLSPDVVSGDCSHERVERSINRRDPFTRIYLV